MNDGELYFERTVTPAYPKKQIFINMDFSDHFKKGLYQQLKDKLSNKISIGTISDFSKGKGAIKLDDEIFKEIRASLFFIADITPIANKSIIVKKGEMDCKFQCNVRVRICTWYKTKRKDNYNL